MSEFDMNEVLRGGRSEEQQREHSGSTTIETYRGLSPYTREHEWASLTEEDQRTAITEGIAPQSESIGGQADGGAGSPERIDTSATDMNSVIREAMLGRRGA